jgi:catechol 2,3-dioxygenase-like lactoylglutathione lyase family enzyme
MEVQFIGSIAVITPDMSRSRSLYFDALGLSLETEPDGYLHSEDIDGSRSFGVWPLTQAAQACSAPRSGRRIDPCRRRASSSRSRTPQACKPPQRS